MRQTDSPFHTFLSSYRSIFLLMLAGFGIIRLWFPLALHYNQVPQLDIRSFTPSPVAGLAYGLLLCGLFALYGWAYRRVRVAARPPAGWILATTAVLFGLLLLNTYPINATDVYRYVIRGRVNSVYGQNQFAVPPNAFPDDSFAPLAGEWAGETSPYGPLWELVATGLTAVSGDNLYLGLLLFKGLGLLAHLGCTLLIWRLLQERAAAERAALTLLWAWNPALLLTFVVNAHNDALMLFWLLLGLWQTRRGHGMTGFLLMVLAPLTKPIGLLPLPLFFLALWRRQPTGQARVRALAVSSVGALLLIVLFFLPFGSPLDLAQRLLRESSQIAGFSPATLLLLVNRALGGTWSLPAVANGARVPFLLLVLWLTWRTWNGRSPMHGAAEVFGGYVLHALAFRLWYAVWLFPWTLVQRSEESGYYIRAGVLFLLTTQLSVLIYGHLRVYALGGSQLWAHLIGVPFTFLLPLLLATRAFSLSAGVDTPR